MEFASVDRSSVSDQVFRQLRDAILTGAMSAEDTLPAERELAAHFGVNRHAVREAVKRLQQSNLITLSQGEPTKVRDWRNSAGLDLAVAFAQTGDRLPADNIVRDMLEMRACIGADAARLCARRADAALLDELNVVVNAMDDADADLDVLDALNIQLWRLVIDGADNLAYLLAFNSLVNEALAVSPVPPEHRSEELLDIAGHRQLVQSIVAHHAQDAYAYARRLLTHALPSEHERNHSSCSTQS